MSGDFDLLLRDRIASARQQGAHDRANGVAFSACPFARVSLVNAWEAGWNEEDQRVAEGAGEAIDLMFVLRKSLKKQKARSENSKQPREGFHKEGG